MYTYIIMLYIYIYIYICMYLKCCIHRRWVCTGLRKPIGYFIFISDFLQKSPRMCGSLEERDL